MERLLGGIVVGQIPEGSWIVDVTHPLPGESDNGSVQPQNVGICPPERAVRQIQTSPLVAPRLDGTQPWDVKTWQIGLGTERCRRVYDGCILVGDAGSFADPLSGAGIHNALLTGKLAAEAISAALEGGNVSARALSSFNRAWKRYLLSSLRLSKLLQSTLFSYPWLLNTIVPRIRLDNVWGKVIANQL